MNFFANIFISITALLIFSTANAAPVKWFFKDAIFNDGGTITGSFVYDISTDIMSSIQVSTTAGAALAGNSYDSDQFPVGVWIGTVVGFLNSADGPDYLGDSVLTIFVAGTLTDAGGTFDILVASPLISQESTCSASDCATVTAPFRVPAGTLTSVPVPGAVWLFGSALGLLGWMRRSVA